MTRSGRRQAHALLLDMDGTLVDSTGDTEKHWTRWAERRDLPVADVMRHAHGAPSRDTVALFVPADEVAAETAWVENLSQHTEQERALPGALAILTQQLMPVAVVTSATRVAAQVRLRRAGLPEPRVLVTADDVRHGKPHPEPYLRAAELLGVDAEDCVAVEDSPAGVASVTAAGATPLAVSTTFPAAELGDAVAVLDDVSAIRVEAGAVSWTVR